MYYDFVTWFKIGVSPIPLSGRFSPTQQQQTSDIISSKIAFSLLTMPGPMKYLVEALPFRDSLTFCIIENAWRDTVAPGFLLCG